MSKSDKENKTWKSLGRGLYKNLKTGTFYERGTVNGKRTFLALISHKQVLAQEELDARKSQRIRIKAGIEKAPDPSLDLNVGDLIDSYAVAGYPTIRGRARTPASQHWAKIHSGFIKTWWQEKSVGEITEDNLRRYKAWRKENLPPRYPGKLTIDHDISLLKSILLHHEIRLDNSPLLRHKRLYQTSETLHCKDRCVDSGNDLHTLAKMFLDGPRKAEVHGWLILFLAFSGCRINEMLQCKITAARRTEPGFIEQNKWLWIKRSKRGVSPYVVLRPEFHELLRAHRNWLRQRYPNCPWFFPAPMDPKKPVTAFGLNAKLAECSHVIRGDDSLPKLTPHGMRAFYVMVRRSQGATDFQIAYEIGDKTVSIITEAYGAIPENWTGGPEIDFMPTKGEPAWAAWLPKAENVVDLTQETTVNSV